MHPPPLLLSRAPSAQLVIAVAVPVVFGLVTGIMLVVSEPLYVVLSVLGVLGGIGAGFEHPNAGEGAQRGLCGGLLFGTCILAGAALTGAEAKAHVAEPQVVLPIVTTVLGVAFGALGGKLRSRRGA